MKPSSTGGIERPLRKLAIGTPLSIEKRKRLLGYDALGEIENQFQLPFSGTAGNVFGWEKVTISFEVEFWFAPEQRDSPLTVPHFTYGVVISDSQDGDTEVDPPIIIAQVTDWTRDERGAYVGATLLLGAWSMTSNPDFDALVHVTFQGWGAPSEDDISVVATDGGSQ